MLIKKVTLCIGLLFFHLDGMSQSMSLFDREDYMHIVEKGADLVYLGQFDSASHLIDSLETLLPNHPIIPMMRGMNLAWQDQPLHTGSPFFKDHEEQLLMVIELSLKLKEQDPENIESIFFEMSARGLMAEYYADEGSTYKAMTEARQTYGLIKESMELTGVSPEFLFLTGLYNYFREKYPERHPMYKSVVWIFKSGDIQLGLAQLDEAVHQSKIVKIEAHLYLAYIYLRYENDPGKAKYYLERLNTAYPTNALFQAKYLECLIKEERYQAANELVAELIIHEKPYYQMCGLIYKGYIFENSEIDLDMARRQYKQGLEIGKLCQQIGWYYRSVAYLGLGRIAEQTAHVEQAVYYYEKVIGLDEDDLLVEEAEYRLDKIN